MKRNRSQEATEGGSTEGCWAPTAFPEGPAGSLLPTLVLIADCHFDDLCKNPEGRSVATMRTAHVDRSHSLMSRNDPAEILVLANPAIFDLFTRSSEEVRVN